MVLRFVAVVVCCLSAWVVQADEGMWMLGNLNKQTRRAMKELVCKCRQTSYTVPDVPH